VVVDSNIDDYPFEASVLTAEVWFGVTEAAASPSLDHG
jgi:hypothetical protein